MGQPCSQNKSGFAFSFSVFKHVATSFSLKYLWQNIYSDYTAETDVKQ